MIAPAEGSRYNRHVTHIDDDGYTELLAQLIIQAVEDYRALVKKGLIVDGRSIDDAAWPLRKQHANMVILPVMEWYRGRKHVEELIAFLAEPGDMEIVLDWLGCDAPADYLRRGIGAGQVEVAT